MSETEGRRRACAKADLQSGEMIGVQIDGLPDLVVYRVGDEFFCTEDTCTHGAASLCGEGLLDGHVIECSRHGGKFDIRTGAACALPCTEPLRTYATTVVGADVYVDVDRSPGNN